MIGDGHEVDWRALDVGALRGRISLDDGTLIREYVTPAGKVFEVSWQGPFVPNMQQLLGNYFPQLQQHVQVQTGRRRGPLNLHNNDFIFSSSGHMRAYHGRAYVPSLLPTNVSPEVVQ